MRLPPYPRYKSSGVEWLGDVPEHWEVKAIKWESPVLRGASPRPIDDPVYFDDDEGEFAWVRISDVTAAGMFLAETEQKLSRLGSSLSVKLKPGALLLSIAGSVGKPCITKIKCCIHDGFVYFPRFKGDPKFLYYLFASGEPYRGLGKLGTQLNLNTDTVGSIVASFPDPAEQRAIAAYLDRETGRIDALVAKKRELIERLKEKRTALISRTVTRGLSPAAALEAGLPVNPPLKRSGLDWLGDIPKHWEIDRLRRLCIRVTDGAHISPDLSSSDFPFVSTVDVANGEIDFAGCLRTSEECYEYLVRTGCRPFEGDVLFSKDGTVGRTAVVSKSVPFVVASSLVIISPKPKSLNSKFLNYWLNNSLLQQDILLQVSGAALKRISVEKVSRLPVVVPPLPEQAAIAVYLDEETAKLDALVGKVEEAVERLQEYRTALITAAVTGKIDVRSKISI